MSGQFKYADGELRKIQTRVVDPIAARELLISDRTAQAQRLAGQAGFEGVGVSLIITGIGPDGTKNKDGLQPEALAEYAAYDIEADNLRTLMTNEQA